MVFQLFRGPAQPATPETKASATGPVVAYASSGRVAWSPRDTVSLTKTGFSGNPVGFRAVKLIAEAAAALPLVLQDAERRYDAHPALALLTQPNPGQGRAELLEALYGQLLLSGDGYLEAVHGTTSGLPFELHVLRSDRMRLIPGNDGWPVAYEYTVGARKHRFDMTGEAAPICHIKSFNPQDDHYGLSPMQAAAQALDVHNSASRWSKGLLDNAARPSGAIVYTGGDGYGTLSPEQYDRLVGRWKRITWVRGMPTVRCCLKVVSTGNRWASRRRTWNSTNRRKPRRGKSRSPSGCRRCCWASRERRHSPITRKRTGPSIA